MGGYLKDYKRRFWQGSTDHRGVPGSPGRVVTLIHKSEADFSSSMDESVTEGSSSSDSYVWGMCYKIKAGKEAETLGYLDFREKGGYTRSFVNVFETTSSDHPSLKRVLLYTATTENPEYLGPAPLEQIASQILHSIGPSGPNFEYLLELSNALLSNGIKDDHISTLANLVKQKQLERKIIEN